MQIPTVPPLAYMLRMDTPPFSMPLMQFTGHFCRGTTCMLFTLGDKCTSYYATHITYAAFLFGNNLHPFNLRKQVHFLPCRSTNLWSISNRTSSQYPTTGSWLCYLSSRTERNSLHCTLHWYSWERYDSNYSPFSYLYISGEIGLCILGRATGQEEKLWRKTSDQENDGHWQAISA